MSNKLSLIRAKVGIIDNLLCSDLRVSTLKRSTPGYTVASYTPNPNGGGYYAFTAPFPLFTFSSPVTSLDLSQIQAFVRGNVVTLSGVANVEFNATGVTQAVTSFAAPFVPLISNQGVASAALDAPDSTESISAAVSTNSSTGRIGLNLVLKSAAGNTGSVPFTITYLSS